MVSNKGRIKSCERKAKTWRGTRTIREKVMSTNATNGHGYYYVTFTRNGKRKNEYVHRLVAEAFIPNPMNLPCVNHKNYDTSNNEAENLEWVTQEENVRYSRLRMRKERASHRQSGTGEKYIYVRSYSNRTRYRVCIRRDGYDAVEKQFSTLSDAIAFRDSILSSRKG